MKTIFLIMCFVFALFVSNANATLQFNATLISWDTPTTNTDGTPLTEAVGYKVYCSATSRGTGTYDTSLSTTVTTTVLELSVSISTVLPSYLPNIVYYCSVTDFLLSNNAIESDYSKEELSILKYGTLFIGYYSKPTTPENFQ